MYLHIMFCPCSLKYQLCCWTVLDSSKRQKLQILGACVHRDQNSRRSPLLFCSLPLFLHLSRGLRGTCVTPAKSILSYPFLEFSFPSDLPLLCFLSSTPQIKPFSDGLASLLSPLSLLII